MILSRIRVSACPGRVLRLVSAFALAALLAGCASAPRAVLDADFQLRGKLAVRGAERPFSARFSWLQLGPTFDVELWGPFGQGRRRLRGSGDRLEVLDGNGVLLQAGPAEAVLAANLGFSLPLDALRFWIQGRPSPDLPIIGLEPGSSVGRPARLEQGGWVIRYTAWAAMADLDRPEKIIVQGRGYELRLALNW